MSLSNGRAKSELPEKKAASAEEVGLSGEQSPHLPSEPPASFDEWLDRRLKVLYEAVIKEPLPSEILDLLQKPRRSK